MSGESVRPTLGRLLILAAACLAILSRIGELGWPPLTDDEAVNALAAASMTGDGSAFWNDGLPVTPSAPAYASLTGIWFALAGSSNEGARLWPAIAGIALVLLPLVLRSRGESRAILTVFLLLLSPAALVAARTAGGASLAALGAFAAACLWHSRTIREPWRSTGIGVGLGLAAAAGASGLVGLMGLAAAFSISRVAGWQAGRQDPAQPGISGRSMALGALAGGIAAASAFAVFPAGIGGIAEGLETWLRGWTAAPSLPALPSFFGLLLYEPLVFWFGLLGAVRAIRARDGFGLSLAVWALLALLLSLLYPGRQASEWIFAVLPLALLAAEPIAELLGRLARGWTWEGQGAIAFMVLLFSGVAFVHVTAYAAGLAPGQFLTERIHSLYVAVAALLLAVSVVALFGILWDWRVALEGGGLGWLVVLILIGVSSAWNLNYGPQAATSVDLWRPRSRTIGMALLQSTLEDVSQAHTGRTDSLAVQTASSPPAGLAWALRTFPRADPAGVEVPPVVLVPVDQEPVSLRAEYVGQDFPIGESWAWTGALPPDPVSWWARRVSPVAQEHWRMLVRADLATFGSMVPESETAP